MPNSCNLARVTSLGPFTKYSQSSSWTETWWRYVFSGHLSQDTQGYVRGGYGLWNRKVTNVVLPLPSLLFPDCPKWLNGRQKIIEKIPMHDIWFGKDVNNHKCSVFAKTYGHARPRINAIKASWKLPSHTNVCIACWKSSRNVYIMA